MTGKIKETWTLDKDFNRVTTKTYFIDGVEVTKKKFDKAFPNKPLTDGVIGGHLPACWPMTADTVMPLSVHPKQRAEAMADAAAKGVPTHFNERGDPVFTDRAHYKAYTEKYGYFNRDGGYSDAQPGKRNDFDRTERF